MYFDEFFLAKIFNGSGTERKTAPTWSNWTFIRNVGREKEDSHGETVIKQLNAKSKKTGINSIFFQDPLTKEAFNFEKYPLIFPDIILDRNCFIPKLNGLDNSKIPAQEKIQQIADSLSKNTLREFPRNATDCGTINTCKASATALTPQQPTNTCSQ